MAGQNYARGIPMGNNQMPASYIAPPAVAAVATKIKDSATTTSSILILTQNTTAIEVTASGGPAYIKWLTQAVVDSSVAGTSVIATGATANFDHSIPAASYRRFVVPIASNVPQGYSSQVGANRENGLYPNVAYVGVATSIIAINEYGSSNGY